MVSSASRSPTVRVELGSITDQIRCTSFATRGRVFVRDLQVGEVNDGPFVGLTVDAFGYVCLKKKYIKTDRIENVLML